MADYKSWWPGTKVVNDENDPVKAQLIGSKENVVHGNHDAMTPVNPGTSERVDIFATPGWIAEPIHYGIFVPAPPGATTGSHRVVVSLHSTLSVYRLLDVTADYNELILIGRGNVISRAEHVVPADVGAQAVNAQRLFINADTPLVIVYNNNTDVVQTETRQIRTVRHERAVIY